MHDHTNDLAGRVVIVPQAHTDAGAAVARAMCEAGATAVLVGDGFARLGAVAAAIHGDTGAPVMIFAGDLAARRVPDGSRRDGVGALPDLTRGGPKT